MLIILCIVNNRVAVLLVIEDIDVKQASVVHVLIAKVRTNPTYIVAKIYLDFGTFLVVRNM